MGQGRGKKGEWGRVGAERELGMWQGRGNVEGGEGGKGQSLVRKGEWGRVWEGWRMGQRSCGKADWGR